MGIAIAASSSAGSSSPLSGDERAAAKMLTHIQENLNHDDASKWTDEFKKLLQTVPAEAAP